MEYEIEFHPVGDASRAGDAISVRYNNGDGQHNIMVIDGGTDGSGDALVEHIRKFYGNGDEVFISDVISTHPDTDHACGLRAILRAFPVGTLWIHPLWEDASEMLPYFSDPRWTAQGLANNIRQSYPVVEELLELASDNGALVAAPFQGAQIGPLTVLSPSRWSYLRLVPQFRKTPEANTDALENDNMLLSAAPKGGLLAALLEKAAKAISWVNEDWAFELLKEGALTAAENESSTVLFGQFGQTGVLFTADAGVQALTWARTHADRAALDWSSLGLIQVPHHGSRSNVTPSVLDKILGPKRNDQAIVGQAIVSAPKDDEKHPRKMVMNAFRRRGWPVGKTQGVYWRKYSDGYPARPGEVQAKSFDWFSQVEAYD
jgi:beta-lactamase superfamily II metal-dependent hydrolase